MLLQVTVGAK
jgi:hypothetical protein